MILYASGNWILHVFLYVTVQHPASQECEAEARQIHPGRVGPFAPVWHTVSLRPEKYKIGSCNLKNSPKYATSLTFYP